MVSLRLVLANLTTFCSPQISWISSFLLWLYKLLYYSYLLVVCSCLLVCVFSALFSIAYIMTDLTHIFWISILLYIHMPVPPYYIAQVSYIREAFFVWFCTYYFWFLLLVILSQRYVYHITCSILLLSTASLHLLDSLDIEKRWVFKAQITMRKHSVARSNA